MLVERICEHGVDDDDSVAYFKAHGEEWAGTYGCDGCCTKNWSLWFLFFDMRDDTMEGSNHKRWIWVIQMLIKQWMTDNNWTKEQALDEFFPNVKYLIVEDCVIG